MKKEEKNTIKNGVSRRLFLSSSALIASVATLTPIISWADVQSLSKEQKSFSELAHFVTNKSALDDIVIQRAYNNLTAEDSDFLQNTHTTWQAITKAKLKSADDLNNHPILQNAIVGTTIKKIVSAFYLGYTGTPIPARAKDNTRFVTYTDALMYKPTIDTTVIPSYSRGHTNYWADVPDAVKKHNS